MHATKALLTAATREAGAWLEAKYDAGLPPFFSATSRWTVPAPPGPASRRRRKLMPIRTIIRSMTAGIAYSYAYIGIKRLGAGQFYLISIRDKDGRAFDGGKTYRLTVPANPPVEQYWSVTAYDRETHALIKNMPRASRSSHNSGAAEERRRLGRHLSWPGGAGGQGCELGADRSGAQVRTDVPRSTRRPRHCSKRGGCLPMSRRSAAQSELEQRNDLQRARDDAEIRRAITAIAVNAAGNGR